MMQATEPWHRDDADIRRAALCRFSAVRRLLAQTEVYTIIVVIGDKIGHKALQVSLIEDDHLIEQIASAIAGESLGDPALPGTSEIGSLGLDASSSQRVSLPDRTRSAESYSARAVRPG